MRDNDKFSVMPQRGYGLQPRVAVTATLGRESDLWLQPQRGCICLGILSEKKTQPRCGWTFLLL